MGEEPFDPVETQPIAHDEEAVITEPIEISGDPESQGEAPQKLDATSDPHHLVGSTLDGQYLIESLIGVGGMGVVYLANQIKFDRSVAIKVLKPNNERTALRFEREAQLSSKLNHPNVVTLYDAGQSGPLLYIVMELLTGKPLKQILEIEAPLSAERSINIVGQMLASLSAAHDMGIIHRDVKPDNVFIRKMGTGKEHVTVLDFGIAKIHDRSRRDMTLTQDGWIFGTPKYMSPEQARAMKDIDPRSDIYSVGVVLFQCLTAKTPFNADDPVSLLYFHLKEPPPPFPHLKTPVPEVVQRIVYRALEKRPEERYQSAQEMNDALSHAFDSVLTQTLTKGRPVVEKTGETTDKTIVDADIHDEKTTKLEDTVRNGAPRALKAAVIVLSMLLVIASGILAALIIDDNISAIDKEDPLVGEPHGWNMDLSDDDNEPLLEQDAQDGDLSNDDNEPLVEQDAQDGESLGELNEPVDVSAELSDEAGDDAANTIENEERRTVRVRFRIEPGEVESPRIHFGTRSFDLDGRYYVFDLHDGDTLSYEVDAIYFLNHAGEVDLSDNDGSISVRVEMEPDCDPTHGMINPYLCEGR